jgi:hypothetical protein
MSAMVSLPARPALIYARAVAQRAVRGAYVETLEEDERAAHDACADAELMARVGRAVEDLVADRWSGAPPVAAAAAAATWEMFTTVGLLGPEWLDDPARRFEEARAETGRAIGVALAAPDDNGLVTVQFGTPVETLRGTAGIVRPIGPARGMQFGAESAIAAGDLVALGTRDSLVRRAGPPRRLPHPPTVAACVAVGADAANVLRAEALAREVAVRLAPERPRDVVWRFGVDVQHLRRAFLHNLDAAMKQEAPTPDERADVARIRGDQTDDDLAARMVRRDQGRAWLYEQLAPRAGWSHIPNPFTPLLELWALGYPLDAITDDALTLACPPLPAGIPP